MIPKGAITTTDELQALARKPVWAASPTHCRGLGNPHYLSGDIGVTIHPNKSEYKWYEYRFSEDDYQYHRSSLLDMNIPANGYNDWYLFANAEDAQAWIDTKP